MAQDLGLHREAEHWSRIGVSLFTPEENLQRKWVWWACVIADKYVAVRGDGETFANQYRVGIFRVLLVCPDCASLH